MFESARKNDGMVDQKIFKTAKIYGFDSVYFDESTIEMLAKYITYVRPLLNPTCEYVLVNRNGKQFQKLSDLFSVLVFEAIVKYIHPTRYRQIIETESCQFSCQTNRNGYLKIKSTAQTLPVFTIKRNVHEK